MISWFTKNDVAANLLMTCIIMAGLYSMSKAIPVEIFPSIDPSNINVTVSLRGATPEDSELGIAQHVEQAISDLEGIKQYSSYSYEGGASVDLEVADGYEPREILDDVKGRVDAINTFPNNAERPIIKLTAWNTAVITTTVSGDVSEREIKELAERVREDILAIPGITQVQLSGVRDYEIAVELDQDRLREYNLNLELVSQAISQNSLDLSAGNLKTAGGDILIRSKGQAYRQNEFENIPLITNKDGSILRLGDIARIDDGFEESAVRTRFNGKLAAGIDVYRTGDQSAIDIADKVKAYIAEKQNSLPAGVAIEHWDDRSDVLKKRISTLVSNAITGGVLVFILLSLFLRPMVALWVFVGIPVAFLGAFAMMPLLGITINLVSLFGFIVVLGIVVDDAIVTGENIYTHLGRSESGIDAAIRGTKEVATPVTFGVLTTIAAFVPMAFTGGHRGPIFAQIPAVVIPCLLFSLIESKFVLPAHLKHLKVEKNKEPKPLQRAQQNFSRWFEGAILRYYQPALRWCLEHKWATVISFFGVLFSIITAISVGHTRYTFFPRIPSETIRISLEMPAGTPFEVTDKHIQRITNAAQKIQDQYSRGEDSVVENILSSTGDRGGASNKGRVRIELTPPEMRAVKVESQEITRQLRNIIGTIPGAEKLSFMAEIGRSSDPIDIQLRAQSYEDLKIVTKKLKDRLATYPSVFDIHENPASGKQELMIELKPEAYLLGVTRTDVIQQIRQAFFGLEAQRIQRGRDDVRVMVRFPIEERTAMVHLNRMQIRTATGSKVPLQQIVDFVPQVGPSTIVRIDGYRTVSVRADVEKNETNMALLQRDLYKYLDALLVENPNVSYKIGGEGEEESETYSTLIWGTMGTLFVIFCLLAIPFKSYIQPLIVMSVIPFGIIGAMVGHWLMGMNLTIMSILGIVALIGVIVNDSLVLVDYINKTIDRTGDTMEAILKAGAARFRPVMLTSLTTFIGLVPLLFEKETQAQFLIPMAVSLGFGIIFATAITLILVPINFLFLHRARERLSGIRKPLPGA
ncbi:MAG: efflux RND transporter permease subunit [Agarilytica sp.]